VHETVSGIPVEQMISILRHSPDGVASAKDKRWCVRTSERPGCRSSRCTNSRLRTRTDAPEKRSGSVESNPARAREDEAACAGCPKLPQQERGNPLTYIAQVKNFGGTIRFSDRMKRMQYEDRYAGDRWTAFVSVFGRDTVGSGPTREAAVGDAVSQLPPFLSKHFR
jgi:hypothetical protein